MRRNQQVHLVNNVAQAIDGFRENVANPQLHRSTFAA